MAALSGITAVRPTANTQFSKVVYGATISAGQPLYLDSTVYSAKRILVTSDQYYGATDQRKFKIANGTDTWSNLDYMPIGTGGASGLLHGTATQVSAGVYTTTISGVSAYTTGDVYAIKFTSVNDNGSTININSLGAVNIYKNSIVPLESGDIKANQEIIIVYDGTNFQAIGLTEPRPDIKLPCSL